MATRGLHSRLLYRTCDVSGRTVDDDGQQHDIHLVVGDTVIPVPADARHKLAPGLFAVNMAIDGPDVGFLGSTRTESLHVEVVPMVRFDHLHHRPVGTDGGALAVGTSPGCLQPQKGGVAVQEVRENAITEKSLATDCLTQRQVADNALHNTALGDGAISHKTVTDGLLAALAAKIVRGAPLETDEHGRATVSVGVGPGQLKLVNGLVSALTRSDLDGVFLHTKQQAALATAFEAVLTEQLTSRLQSVARKSDIPRQVSGGELVKSLETSALAGVLQGLKETVAQLLDKCGEGLTRSQVAEEFAKADVVQVLPAVRDLLVGIAGVLNKPVRASLEDVLGDKDAAGRLRDVLTDGEGAVLNASLAGDVAGDLAGMSEGVRDELAAAVRSVLLTATSPAPTGAPGSRASLQERLDWLYVCQTHPREVFSSPDGKKWEAIRNDAGTTILAKREITEPSPGRVVYGKWQG